MNIAGWILLALAAFEFGAAWRRFYIKDIENGRWAEIECVLLIIAALICFK